MEGAPGERKGDREEGAREEGAREERGEREERQVEGREEKGELAMLKSRTGISRAFARAPPQVI